MTITRTTIVQDLYNAGYLSGPNGLSDRDISDFFEVRSRYGLSPEPPVLDVIRNLTIEGLVDRLRSMTLTICCFQHEKPRDEGGFDYRQCILRMLNLGCGHGDLPLLPLRIAIVVLHKQDLLSNSDLANMQHALSSYSSSLSYADTEAYRVYGKRNHNGSIGEEDLLGNARNIQSSDGNRIKNIRDLVVKGLDNMLIDLA